MRESESSASCLIRPTTPTIVIQGPGESARPSRSRLPSGLSFGQYCAAMCASMRVTRWPVRVSCSVKSRPWRSGISIARKYSPPTIRMSTLMNFSPAAGTRPSIVIGPHAIIWLSGSELTPPAAVTPGSRASRAQSRRYVSSATAASLYFRPIIVSSSVRTFCGLKPGGTS